MPVKDHYQLLDIAPDADRRTIRKAYRKALRRHHPDSNPERKSDEDILLQVIEAGRVLSDQKRRADYDQQCAKRSHPQKTKPTGKNRPAALECLKYLTDCMRLLDTGRLACKKFFDAKQAKATEDRAARLRKQKTPEFDAYLNVAIKKNKSYQYHCDADGIYRKSTAPPQKTTLQNWQKRTVIWLLIGIILWRA